jgi:hypothetical protein
MNPSQPTQPSGVQKLLIVMLLDADRRRATHIRIKPAGTAAVIEFWIDRAWQESQLTDRSLPLHAQLMRRIAEFAQQAVPPPGHLMTGRMMFERGGAAPLYILVGIDHDHELAAYLELVDQATWETGRDPQPPVRPA